MSLADLVPIALGSEFKRAQPKTPHQLERQRWREQHRDYINSYNKRWRADRKAAK